MSALGRFARDYAAHAGLPAPDGGWNAAVAARVAPWPAWARALVPGAAFAATWLAPLFLLGRPRSFGGLAPDERERLLTLLQDARSPLLRGAFLLVKAPTLSACYAARRGA